MTLMRRGRRAAPYGFAFIMGALAYWAIVLPARAVGPACAVAGNIFEFEPYLPRTLAALEMGGDVTIVAIGGASTEGKAAGHTDRTWPARLQEVLAVRYPKARVRVLNRGIARETALQMAARFERDVLAAKPELVIWETGTNDAVRATDIDDFRDTIHGGIARLRASVPEVMLMNPQFSRRSEFVVNLNRYITIMRGVADLDDLPLFPRHEIMRGWGENGVFNFTIAGREQRRDLAIQVYGCLATAIADMIARRPPADAP